MFVITEILLKYTHYENNRGLGFFFSPAINLLFDLKLCR